MVCISDLNACDGEIPRADGARDGYLRRRQPNAHAADGADGEAAQRPASRVLEAEQDALGSSGVGPMKEGLSASRDLRHVKRVGWRSLFYGSKYNINEGNVSSVQLLFLDSAHHELNRETALILCFSLKSVKLCDFQRKRRR